MIFQELTTKDIERLSPGLIKNMVVHIVEHGRGSGLVRHQRGPCHHCNELTTHVRRQLSLASVGWFGIPGERSEKHATKTHAVIDRKPVCGSRIHPKSEYQSCAPSTKHLDPECKLCKKWVDRIATKAA